VGRPHIGGERLIVFHQFPQHVDRRDKVRLIVFDALQSRDLADRSESGSANAADPLGKHIRHRKDLIALVVQQQMIVAKMGAADMPVEVLRLEIERKRIGYQRVEEAVTALAALADRSVGVPSAAILG
jgi:hypothetical protein